MKVDRYCLLNGPYRSPKVHRGSRLFCEIRGTVIVGFISDGRIPWPCMKKRGGTPTLIVCGDLVRAVKSESAVAVAHHFGVSTGTVKNWRRDLRVPRENDGIRQLWRRITFARTDDRRERGRINSKRPAALAKMSAKLKGRVIPLHVIEAVRKAAKRPRSPAWKKKMAQYWQNRGHPPGHPESRFWTKAEDRLLGTAPDKEIARRLKRSLQSIYIRRRRLGIARL